MNIREQRANYKPFEYQFAYDYYIKQQLVHWTKDEINLSSDLQDWNLKITPAEKEVVGGILKGFTQMEILVGDYWKNVSNWFPKPEIAMMTSAFSYFESIHMDSYSLINIELGLDDFKSFTYDPAVVEKLDYFIIPKSDSPKDIATSLAVFSAFAEGCLLFSSFAVLLSFQRENLFKNIGQIVSLSVRDEGLHSEAGCKLFNQYCEEVPGLRNDCREDIFAAADKVLELETTFLKSIFSKGNVRTISYDQLINFVKHRLNSKLQEIGYTEKPFEVNKTLLDEISWFNMLSAGREFQDFFANRVTEYTEINASAEDLF